MGAPQEKGQRQGPPLKVRFCSNVGQIDELFPPQSKNNNNNATAMNVWDPLVRFFLTF
jgi:hypothetical protein